MSRVRSDVTPRGVKRRRVCSRSIAPLQSLTESPGARQDAVDEGAPENGLPNEPAQLVPDEMIECET
jgi:hypothetical protein